MYSSADAQRHTANHLRKLVVVDNCMQRKLCIPTLHAYSLCSYILSFTLPLLMLHSNPPGTYKILCGIILGPIRSLESNLLYLYWSKNLVEHFARVYKAFM